MRGFGGGKEEGEGLGEGRGERTAVIAMREEALAGLGSGEYDRWLKERRDGCGEGGLGGSF